MLLATQHAVRQCAMSGTLMFAVEMDDHALDAMLAVLANHSTQVAVSSSASGAASCSTESSMRTQSRDDAAAIKAGGGGLQRLAGC